MKATDPHRVVRAGELAPNRAPGGNQCRCVEPHSSPTAIALAFARCKHPRSVRLQIDADGVATGYTRGTRGLLVCTHCGAHRRTMDGSWVYPHLAASACREGRAIRATRSARGGRR